MNRNRSKKATEWWFQKVSPVLTIKRFQHVWGSDHFSKGALKPPDGSSDIDIYIYICPLYAPFYARVEPTFLPWEDECQEFEAEKQSLCIAGF